MREHQRLEEEADFDFQGTAWDLVRSAQQRKRVVFAIKDDYVYKQDNLWILYIYISDINRIDEVSVQTIKCTENVVRITCANLKPYRYAVFFVYLL